jgi:hypothetical protein
MTEKQAKKSKPRYRSRAEADQLAAEYEASGLNRREFCEQNNVALNTLTRYVTRYRRQKADKREPQRWLAVELPEQRRDSSELSVVLPGGRRIEVKRGFDVGTLRELMTVLEQV